MFSLGLFWMCSVILFFIFLFLSLWLFWLGYLTLPYGEDVLLPSTEASNGPNVHPRINRKVTKSPSAVLTWVHTNTWNHPPPKRGPTHLNTWNYLLTCTRGISKRISARKHISTSILVTMTSKTPNQETRVPSPSTPCITSALLCDPGCLFLYVISITL